MHLDKINIRIFCLDNEKQKLTTLNKFIATFYWLFSKACNNNIRHWKFKCHYIFDYDLVLMQNCGYSIPLGSHSFYLHHFCFFLVFFFILRKVLWSAFRTSNWAIVIDSCRMDLKAFLKSISVLQFAYIYNFFFICFYARSRSRSPFFLCPFFSQFDTNVYNFSWYLFLRVI